ncbi:MAG: hypothetical protein KGN77_05125 [Xanthomonadaceae bacterium]|nr:hypothetical protein [Xanthomonadaceae bacterium]
MTACNCAERPHQITRTAAGVRYVCSGCGSETVIPKPRRVLESPTRTSQLIPLVKGGQDHAAHELWSQINPLAIAVAGAAVVLVFAFFH